MPKQDHLKELAHQEAFVRRLARRLTGDEQRAEDLAQDAWVAALERPSHVGGRGWFAAVVHRLWCKGLRGDERRRWREAQAARHEASEVLDEVLAREETRRLVLAAVMELSEPLRACVVLRYLDGLPPRRIARRLDVPVETVKTRLKRGTAQLRARLDERVEGGRKAWTTILLPLSARRPSVAVSLLSPFAVMSIPLKATLAAVPILALLFFTTRALRQPPASPPQAMQAPTSAAGVLPLIERELEAHLRPPSRSGSVRTMAAVEPPEVGETPRAEPTQGSVDVLVRWHDGEPAEGVGVDFTSWGGAEPRFSTIRRVSDEEGRIRVAGLPTGSVSVYPERSDPTDVPILAGETSELVIDLERGFDIHGLVLDQLGNSVAGAGIWMSALGWTDGRIVCTSDEAGEFFVRSWKTMAFLCARAPGYAPSMMPTASGGEGATITIELVLPGRGGAVAGVVSGPTGAPVEGAAVWIDMLDKRRTAGHFPPAPIQALTDADGAFFVDGVQAGACDVKVRAPGFAPAGASIDVGVGRTSEVGVSLAGGVTLVGSVLGLDGEPLVRAHVAVSWGPWEHSVRTDLAGRYVLRGLPAGELEAVIENDDGDARTALFGNDGDVLRWDARIEGGLELSGHVVDAAGVPLESWVVTAVHTGNSFHELRALTDASGRFQLVGARSLDYRVAVAAPGILAISLFEDGVRPPYVDLELVVPEERMPSAYITGRVEYGDGRAAGDVRIFASQAGTLNTPIHHPNAETGAFKIGPLPACQWVLVVVGPTMSHREEPRELGFGERWDLGTIVLE